MYDPHGMLCSRSGVHDALDNTGAYTAAESGQTD
jgi:hypothetical protein